MSRRFIISKYPRIIRDWLEVFEKNLSVTRGLRLDEYVKVIWLDACSIPKVPHGTDPLDAPIATRTETPGRFLGVYLDKEYGLPHLVIVTERSGDMEYWTSIPMPIVRSIIKLTEVEARKARASFVRINASEVMDG